MEYNKDFLEKIRIKLNVRNYSDSWLRKHFRGMLDRLYEIEEEREKGKKP